VLEVQQLNGSRTRRAGPPRSLVLVLVVLAAVVAVGAAFLLLRTRADALNRPAQPLTDEQTKTQVVEPAKQIVAVANLHGASGGYILMSCRNEADPPYQGAIYVTFDLPKSVDYFDRVAAAMVPHGWHEGLPPNQYLFGTTLYKDGVTVILYRDPDRLTTGVMKVYGECRNTADHRNDSTGWTDITDQLHV
jgi:hypothetical protein